MNLIFKPKIHVHIKWKKKENLSYIKKENLRLKKIDQRIKKERKYYLESCRKLRKEIAEMELKRSQLLAQKKKDLEELQALEIEVKEL